MLIIFNKSGNEFNVDFQYDSFSQGDSNTHIVDVIVEDTTFSNYEHNAYVQFLREGEKEPSDKLIMATKRFERNGNYYSGYTFKMQSEWFTAIAGTLKMTIEIKKYSNGALQSNKAYGVVNIPVQPSVSPISEVESKITDEEYNAMIELINSKLNVVDEKVYVLDNNYATIYEFATACIEVAQNNLMDRIFFGNVVSTSQSGLTTTEKCVATIIKKYRVQSGTSYNALVITSTGDVVVTDGTTKLESLAKDSRVLHTIGNLKETVTGEKTFKAEGGKAPVHLDSSFPYVVSDTAGKVGMRAYTENGEYQGEVAGQFAVSYNEEYGGHFANIQARDNEGTLHSLRVSKMGATYHTNKDGVSEKHNIPLDENVVHNSGNETITGEKNFTSRVRVVGNHIDAVLKPEGMYIYDANGNKTAGVFNENGQVKLHIQEGEWSTVIKHDTIQITREGTGVTEVTMPTRSGKLATEDVVMDKVSEIVANAPSDFDTLKEIADWIKEDESGTANLLADVEKKAYRTELFSRNYDDLTNAPEKINIVVRDTISADTYNEAREIQIGRDKFKFGSGSKIKANEFVDGTLPTLEYLNIDGKTYKVPNLVTDGNLKLVAEGPLKWNEEIEYFEMPYQLESGKHYSIQILYEGDCRIIFNGLYYNGELFANVSKDLYSDIFLALTITGNQLFFWDKDCTVAYDMFLEGCSYKIYEIPIGESAQVEKHNKTINALLERVSDLEQKAGLTSVGYVQDSTLNLIRVNVVDDVLEVNGFKFDGEVMII